MRNLCRVSKIDKIAEISGKDRIELATVENFPVIVQKGEFKVGDLCIFCEYDTVLPVKPEFEFLRARSYSALYDGFRIRNMKMGGVYSSGIVFPLSLVDKKYHKLGTDLTYIIGVRKYDPEAYKEELEALEKGSKLFKYLMGFAWFQRVYRGIFFGTSKTYPSTVSKSDEINVEVCLDMLPKNCYYYCTEKMEGSAGTWLLRGKTYQEFSHNSYKDPRKSNIWAKVGDKYELKKILLQHYKETKQTLAIQGEVCGPGIEGNIYGFTSFQLFVYKVTDVRTGIAFNFDELTQFCEKYGLNMVPILYCHRKLLDSVEEMLSDCEGYSVFSNNCTMVPREGVVWRSVTDQSIGCKAKNREYQALLSKRSITE